MSLITSTCAFFCCCCCFLFVRFFFLLFSWYSQRVLTRVSSLAQYELFFLHFVQLWDPGFFPCHQWPSHRACVRVCVWGRRGGVNVPRGLRSVEWVKSSYERCAQRCFFPHIRMLLCLIGRSAWQEIGQEVQRESGEKRKRWSCSVFNQWSRVSSWVLYESCGGAPSSSLGPLLRINVALPLYTGTSMYENNTKKILLGTMYIFVCVCVL